MPSGCCWEPLFGALSPGVLFEVAVVGDPLETRWRSVGYLLKVELEATVDHEGLSCTRLSECAARGVHSWKLAGCSGRECINLAAT